MASESALGGRLSEQSMFSYWAVAPDKRAAERWLGLCLPPSSPPLSPPFHQDEDYWVRKTLRGLTEHYDFKLRTKPSIFLVSFYCRCPMYILMIVELELL